MKPHQKSAERSWTVNTTTSQSSKIMLLFFQKKIDGKKNRDIEKLTDRKKNTIAILSQNKKAAHCEIVFSSRPIVK